MWWRKERERGQGRRRANRAVLEVQALEGKALLSGFGVTGQGEVAYVDSLYANVLHRAPDPAGEAYWVAVLDRTQTGPRQVLRAFVKAARKADGGAGVSAQAATTAAASDKAFVDSLYTDILHRPADPQGEADWIRGLERGMSRAKIARMFAGSPAALAANGGKVVNLGAAGVHPGRNLRLGPLARNRQFVDQLYTSILQRPADAAGEAYYLSQLQAGASRQQIVDAIVISSEAQALGVNPLSYGANSGYLSALLAAPTNRIGLPGTPLTGSPTSTVNGATGLAGATLLGGSNGLIGSTNLGTTGANLLGGTSGVAGTGMAGAGIAGNGLTGTGLTGTTLIGPGLTGTPAAGGFSPLSSATFIGPFTSSGTAGSGTTGFGVGGLTPFSGLGNTAFVMPGLSTTGLGAYGAGYFGGLGAMGTGI